MKILFTDDDPLILDALSACVEREGYQAFVAKDGNEALALWREERPDIICLDIMMAVCNGYQVCQEIRKKDKETPILFLSAKNEVSDVVAGLNLGADDFIRKPFTRAEVMARIRACLRRTQKDSEQFLMLDLTIFPSQLLAKRGEEEIELSPREVRILRLLHRHAGKPVTRDQLLDYCWGTDYFPNSRTLDQHILVLRKKLSGDSSLSVIETVRSVGYMFG